MCQGKQHGQHTLTGSCGPSCNSLGGASDCSILSWGRPLQTSPLHPTPAQVVLVRLVPLVACSTWAGGGAKGTGWGALVFPLNNLGRGEQGGLPYQSHLPQLLHKLCWCAWCHWLLTACRQGVKQRGLVVGFSCFPCTDAAWGQHAN